LTRRTVRNMMYNSFWRTQNSITSSSMRINLPTSLGRPSSTQPWEKKTQTRQREQRESLLIRASLGLCPCIMWRRGSKSRCLRKSSWRWLCSHKNCWIYDFIIINILKQKWWSAISKFRAKFNVSRRRLFSSRNRYVSSAFPPWPDS
jgi:hypothetical protein